MKFDVFTQMEYVVRSPGTLILNIHALRTQYQTVLNEEFTVEPYVKIEEIISAQGENRLMRFEISEPGTVKVTYKALVDNCYELTDYHEQHEVMVAQLDATVLPYLNPSRYCQSDKLYRLSHNLFGHITNPFEKVVTLTDWIHTNVQYLSGYSNAQTSAFDTVTEQVGVCRDFAHLGIALCRALTIPARYFTGYAYKLDPPDFHACFEAYIGGEWLFFDPTKLVPANGLVKIANGRDAADAAVASIFGNTVCTSMVVECNALDPHFEPYDHDLSKQKGLSYQ